MNWVVLIRVNPQAKWCAYGPMTHAEALAFRKESIGTGMEREIANLIPKRPAAETDGENNGR